MTTFLFYVVKMPHESTVAHEQRFVMETPMISRSRTFKLAEEEEEQNKPTVRIEKFASILMLYINTKFKFFVLSIIRKLCIWTVPIIKYRMQGQKLRVM